ncbi:MAG: spore coat protein U domain-containing protein [Mariprofundaceae bacterium]|nr:spore coat protein U domain-containing protein [Mariprofundaceae bacterium]
MRKPFYQVLFPSALLSLCLFLILPFSSYAFTAKNNLAISVVVPPKVQLSATPMSFGTIANTSNTTTRATATITINMVATQAYQITLNAGLYATRRMRNAAGAFIPYTLYQNAAYTTAWGDNTFANTFTAGSPLASVGTGNNQVFMVYGQTQIPANSTPGNFNDTITVTVHY